MESHLTAARQRPDPADERSQRVRADAAPLAVAAEGVAVAHVAELPHARPSTRARVQNGKKCPGPRRRQHAARAGVEVAARPRSRSCRSRTGCRRSRCPRLVGEQLLERATGTGWVRPMSASRRGTTCRRSRGRRRRRRTRRSPVTWFGSAGAAMGVALAEARRVVRLEARPLVGGRVGLVGAVAAVEVRVGERPERERAAAGHARARLEVADLELGVDVVWARPPGHDVLRLRGSSTRAGS